MARYTGLSNQEILSIIKSDTQNKIKNIVDRTVENIQNLEVTYGNKVVYSTTKDIKPNFWDYVMLVPSVKYSLIKGGLEGISSGIAGIMQALAQGVNNITYAIKESEDLEDFYTRQLPFIYTDFTGQIMEGLGVAAISAVANAGKLFGFDSDWAYQEGGVIDDYSTMMLSWRTAPLRGEFQNDIHKAYAEKEKNQELLAGRYYAETETFIRNSVSWQNWISENIIHPFVNTLTLGAKERADIAFADSKIYDFLMGTAESVGNILVAFLLAKLTAGLSTTASASTVASLVSNMYFGSSVFGRSFQEAINNGVSVDDAYTYAWGNALLETGLENIGGFTPSGEIVGANSIYEQISKSTFKDFVKNAVEEGLEEFVSGLASTGLERYANPDRKIDYNENTGDLWAELAFQFLGGALASAGIGLGRNIYLNLSNNVDYKADKLIDEFHKQVKIEGEERSLKRFEKRLNQVVDSLNSTNTRGIVEGENRTEVKKMTLEDKKNFLNRTGLVLLIEEQNGKFQIRERFKGKMTADMFKNKIGTKVVDENVYAVNSMTRGVDLTHNNLVKENELVKIENMNEIEKRAYEFANQRNVPIVFFNSADGDSFYGNNGVIYINTKSLTENNIEETILRHEMVHKIKDTDIELYETIKKKIDSLIELSFDKDTKLPSLKFANETLEKMFKESGHDKRIRQTFAEKLEVLKNLETAIEQTKEEIVAHFIEETLKGGNIIDILSFDKPSKVKQLMNRLTQNKELKAIAEGNKKITKELKEIRKLFEKALKKTVDSEQRLKFFFNHALGINFDFDLRIFQAEEFKNNFKKEILDKHPIELIVSGYIHDYDYIEGTVVIEGTKYHISEILKQDALENANPKYVKTPDEENIQKTFRYQKEKENIYKRILERFINESEQQDKIDLAKETLEQIEQGKQIKNEHRDLLRELYSQYEFALNERSSYRQHIGDNDIISKETQKVISYINEDFSAYKNIFEYRPYTYGLKAGAYGYIELQENETPDMHLNLISTYIHKKFGENFEIDSKVKNNVLEVVISPTQEYIRDLMPSEKTELQHYKSNINELTEEQKQMVKELFDEYAEGVISEIFDVDKKGNLIPKNRRVLSVEKEVNKVKLVDKDGTVREYDGNTYAIRTYFDISNINLLKPNFYGFKEPLKIKDMTKTEKALHDIFKTTQMNYILYRGGESGVTGFAFGDKDNYITYINTSYIEEGFQRLASTLLHETVHKIYAFKQEEAVKFAKQLAELLFVKKEDGTIEKSDVLEHLEKTVYSSFYSTDGFLNYMKSGYSAKKRYAQLNSYKDIYDIMTKDKHNAKESNTLNELIAQFTGHLLMTDSIYKEVLKGKSLVDSSVFKTVSNVYHKIMHDASINNDTKKIFNITLKNFGKLYEKFIVELRKKFPNETDLYDLKYINDFISEFTDGEFTTRGKLLNAYFKEKANKKRGNATIAIDNLIYVASILGENVQRGVNVYNKLKSEFENFKTNVEITLNHPDGIFLLEDARTKFRKINSTIKKISELVKLGELNDTSLFNELRTTLNELHNLYEQIPNEVKEIYGLPSLEEVTKVIDFVQLEIDKVIDFFDYGYEFPNMQDFLDSTVKTFNKIFKNFSTTLNDVEIFGTIKKLQIEYRKNTINNLLNTIEEKVNNTVNQIATTGRQKGVLFTKDLQEIVELANEFHQAIANNAFNYSEMKKVLADVLTKIRNKIISSERIAQIDKQALINNELLTIHLQFAYLFNNNTFVTDYYTGEGFEYLQQLPLSKIVKQFSPDTIATQLSNIIKFFRTDFKSGFNKDFTIEEYTTHTKQQMRALMKEGIQFKTEHLSTLSHYMLPHEFLFMYSELTKGRLDFFNDFYREYVNAAKRRMEIFQEFDMSYKAWLKDHKKAIDYSLEKVDISHEIITYVRSTNEINEIKQQITQEMNIIDDEISKFEKNVMEIKREIKILGEKIKELKNQKNKITDKKSPQYKKLHQEQKELEQQQNKKREIIKGFTEKIYELKEEKNNISFEDRVRARLDRVAKEGIKDKQKITKGELIGLYLSVAREVEMHKIYETDSTIAPTNHFHFGNTVWFVDSKIIVEKGLEVAKNKARQFVIYAQDRETLLKQLEQMIKNDYMAQEILSFAKERFDKNYEYVNEIYSDMYGVDLPKQPTYIPFVTLDSSPTREFEFAQLHRHNIAVAEGMTMRTTLGASTPLQIENIFGVIEKQSKEVQNYSFHRIIEDWQHLLVHKNDAHDTPFGELIKGEGNVFGVDNGIQRTIEKMFLNILQYHDIYESNLSKKIRKMSGNVARALFALNVMSTAKQFASVFGIAAKNKINLSTLSKNTLAATMPTRNKYRTWLMNNNPHFYQRAISGNNAALADQMSFTFAENAWLKIMKPVRKYVDKLSIMGWTDNAIIVGAFKSYADMIRKQNPQLTEQQVLEKANEMLDEVLMYGVASTDSAFRAPFSNAKNLVDMIFSRFQSEGVMQYSSMIRHLYLRKNGVKSARSFKRDVTALLASAFWEALVVTFFWEFLRGAGDEEEFLEKLTVEFIVGSLLGSIPVVNVFINAISVYVEGGNIIYDKGYSPAIPGVDDIIKGIQTLASMSNGKNVGRKLLRAIEHFGQVLGLPIKNISRISSTTANLLKRTGNKTAREIDAFFKSENKSQAYYRAIRENRRSVINAYVEDIYSNVQVRNEIVELLMRNPDKQIKIYDVDSFYTVTEDRKRIHHKIPESIKKRYVELTQRALQRLISNYRYRKFDDEYKIKTIQRIINYYYNHMKEVVLNNKKAHEIDDVMKVVERALSISEQDIKEKRKKA